MLLPVPALADNYIWLLSTDAGADPLVVDPGDAAPVLQALDGRTPAGILLTHHHDDHIGGTAELLRHWPQLPVFAPHDERIAVPATRVHPGDAVSVGPWAFTVLDMAGHTRSHVAFHGHGVVFCGDTLFSLGCGRLFEGTPAQMLAALDRLAALPDTTWVCCAHEYTQANAAFAQVVDADNPTLRQRAAQVRAQRAAAQPTLPTRLGAERAANPFLRVDAPAVRAAVLAQAGLPADASRVDVFAALRRWKDGFRA